MRDRVRAEKAYKDTKKLMSMAPTRRLIGASSLARRSAPRRDGAGLWPKWGVAMVSAPSAVAAAPWRRAATSGAASEVVVFGGNGFVGSQVCKALVGMGLRVAAINRSGAPREREEWMSGVDYIAADVFEPAVRRTTAACERVSRTRGVQGEESRAQHECRERARPVSACYAPARALVCC
jgi:hypothetical protein